jgi:hypothetical protein
MVLQSMMLPHRNNYKHTWMSPDEEFTELCSWAGHVACIGENRGVYRILVGNLRQVTTREIQA